MKYYNRQYYDTLCHSDEKRNLNGTSVSDEKGTDGKANNTSAYNHDYYMKHKDKWGVKTKEYTKGDSDFDDENLKEQNRIGKTNFFAFKNKKGEWVITEEDMKWVLPKGTELTSEIKNKLASLEGKNFDTKEVENIIAEAGSNGEKEFDIDAAALDVIRGKYKNGAERRAALGDDYEMVQKRVNEMYAEGRFGSGTKKTASEEKK